MKKIILFLILIFAIFFSGCTMNLDGSDVGDIKVVSALPEQINEVGMFFSEGGTAESRTYSVQECRTFNRYSRQTNYYADFENITGHPIRVYAKAIGGFNRTEQATSQSFVVNPGEIRRFTVHIQGCFADSARIEFYESETNDYIAAAEIPAIS